MKICTGCNQKKTKINFDESIYTKDKLMSWCKECRGKIIKICIKCNKEKTEIDFYKSPHTKDKLQSWCKSCHTKIMKEWQKKNPNKYAKHQRNGQLKKKYGISYKELEQMYNEQGGKCSICQCKISMNVRDGRKERVCVDHNHKSGKVRKLLCRSCNAGVGYFQESEEILRRAIWYLHNERRK
jgi:arsenate reductase-like glutaredoxin family protein